MSTSTVLIISELILIFISKTRLPKERIFCRSFTQLKSGENEIVSYIRFVVCNFWSLSLIFFRSYPTSRCLYFQYSKQASAFWVLSYVWFWCKDSSFGWREPLDALQSAKELCFYQNTGRSQVRHKLLHFSTISHFLEEYAIMNAVKYRQQ